LFGKFIDHIVNAVQCLSAYSPREIYWRPPGGHALWLRITAFRGFDLLSSISGAKIMAQKQIFHKNKISGKIYLAISGKWHNSPAN